MSHPYDEEALATYIGGDLSQEEAQALERHLAECAFCRREVARFRADAAAVARFVSLPVAAPAGARPVRTGRRPWLPAVAAVTVLVLAALLIPARTDLLAAIGTRVFDLLPRLHVREMPLTDAEAYVRERMPSPGARIDNGTFFDSVADAEQKLGYAVGRPAYLPAGFGLSKVQVLGLEHPETSSVNQVFTGRTANPVVSLNQSVTAVGQWEVPIPDGATEEVSVLGKPALLINGGWRGTPETGVAWKSGGQVRLLFQWQERNMDLSVIGMADADMQQWSAELVKIAESIK